jgi:hypothetical protein
MNIYRRIYEKIAGYMKPGGSLIVINVGRQNLWPMLGLRNPFVPTIRWHIHQDTGFWRRFLLEIAYQRVEFEWMPKYPLRHIRPLIANRTGAFMTDSMFHLVAYVQ